MQWFTAMMGTCHSCDSMRATTAHVTSGPPMPGPCTHGGLGWMCADEKTGRAGVCSTHRCTCLLRRGGRENVHLCVGDAADVIRRHRRIGQRLLHQLQDVLLRIRRIWLLCQPKSTKRSFGMQNRCSPGGEPLSRVAETRGLPA